ncbi:MAG: WYL domain-containing protein, partial [Lachnospiraceae bacterium]|nr:WYL domain-containing protein [Lachnospiraceae bacterium]
KGYYLASRDFEDAELRMLIDSVLFSRHISEAQGKRLVEKLEQQSNEYFRNSVSHVRTLPNLYHTANKQVLYVLDALNTAIGRHKKVQFTYNSYGTDFKLHPRKEEPYIVNPYQMVANNGFYYLIGNMDKYDNLIHFRIDRITDVDVLETRSRSMKELKGMEKGFNLPKHMAEHIYMFCGETVRVTIKTEISMMDNLVDWFGNSFTILNKDEKDNSMKISVNCNYNAMFYWALQFGMHAEVLSPDKLRKEISDALQKIAGKYST